MEQYKVSFYNLNQSSISPAPLTAHAVEIVEAQDFMDAQETFRKKHPGATINDIELLDNIIN